ncbi:Abi family protein [Lachnospiraceae bacterium CLA-AA-H246]|uniref:Abi family protein n=2 Tax=Hominisplanchenecus TaxID=2941498 RepID=A0ABS8EVG7_9FIRM|nr:Abi family protein [Hominisplanchenecus faecis]MCC2149191.1 Abi family protein [Hominisplanchenecus faecis]
MKQLLSIEELIQHMKNRGITFNEISENDAKQFLQNNNYYMKLAAYRANYDKCDTGKRQGQYKKLDFGYLKELSTIDMYLRYIVMDMCLDIEHVIKVRLIKNITNNPSEDGYDIVRKFIAQDDNLRILKNIRSHKSGEYCKDLIEKYYPYFPVWVFVELISFGDLLYFCSFYEKIYGVQIINNKLMNTVRDVRNAAAHSNCLLNKMTEKIDSTKQVNNEISSFIIGMKNISKTSRVNNLSYKFTNSFVTVLYVYDSLMNEIPKQKRYKEIQEFMNGRVVKNKQFFQSNSKIVGVYNFHKKVIDNLVK